MCLLIAALCVVHARSAPGCSWLLQDLGGARQVVPDVLSVQQLGPAVGRTGRAIVGVSGGGEYVSVCWPASRGYVVYYRTLAGTWQEVESGSGVDLAWHSHRYGLAAGFAGRLRAQERLQQAHCARDDGVAEALDRACSEGSGAAKLC
jgi:hypothetical protein